VLPTQDHHHDGGGNDDDHDASGAVIDVYVDDGVSYVDVTVYYNHDTRTDHHRHDDDGGRDALIRALTIVERTCPGVLYDATTACRADDAHNGDGGAASDGVISPADVRE
jgi:hypothetical protein